MHQTCQLSLFWRESQNFLSFLTASQQHSQSHGIWGKTFWNELSKMEIQEGMLVSFEALLADCPTLFSGHD